MTESEKMDLILSGLKEIRTDISELKEDVSELKEDVSVLKEDVSELNQEVSGIKLHLENVTNKNISILAENHIELVRKLNAAIPAADSNRIYEIQVNYLTERVTRLEKDFQDFKDQNRPHPVQESAKGTGTFG